MRRGRGRTLAGTLGGLSPRSQTPLARVEKLLLLCPPTTLLHYIALCCVTPHEINGDGVAVAGALLRSVGLRCCYRYAFYRVISSRSWVQGLVSIVDTGLAKRGKVWLSRCWLMVVVVWLSHHVVVRRRRRRRCRSYVGR